MFMEMKVLPCKRGYWMNTKSFLYCQQITFVMSKRRFEAIRKCLHIKDDSKASTN